MCKTAASWELFICFGSGENTGVTCKRGRRQIIGDGSCSYFGINDQTGDFHCPGTDAAAVDPAQPGPSEHFIQAVLQRVSLIEVALRPEPVDLVFDEEQHVVSNGDRCESTVDGGL